MLPRLIRRYTRRSVEPHGPALPQSFRLALSALAFCVVPLPPGSAHADSTNWTQWGGPSRDFCVRCDPLATSWPDEGPPTRWSRPFGEGYSAILAEDDRLYTMMHVAGKEAVVCLSAADGKTLWEHSYDVTIPARHERQFGVGPRATPLIVGDRIFATGVTARLHCLDKRSGKVIWHHDLTSEFDATVLQHGYSSSPLAYKDTVIVPVGGKGHGLMAFNQVDGKVRWAALDGDNSYSSPKLITVDGVTQLVCFLAPEIAGVNPDTGKLLWRFEFKNQYGQNVMLPVWGEDNLLFISAPESGSRVLRLAVKNGKTTCEQVWEDRKLQVYHGGAVRIGDYVYAVSGTMGPAFFFAVNVKTGEVAYKERGIAKATCVHADGKLIVLDENGNLLLATATPKELIRHASAAILKAPAWTVPTLVGHTLYLRDLKTVMAMDLK